MACLTAVVTRVHVSREAVRATLGVVVLATLGRRVLLHSLRLLGGRVIVAERHLAELWHLAAFQEICQERGMLLVLIRSNLVISSIQSLMDGLQESGQLGV